MGKLNWKGAGRVAWRLAKANAAGYAVMLVAFGLMYLLGLDGWTSFWLCRVPSWLTTLCVALLRK